MPFISDYKAKATTKLDVDAILGDYNSNRSGVENPLWNQEKPRICKSQQETPKVKEFGTQMIQQGGQYSSPGASGDLLIELPEDYLPGGSAEAYFAAVSVFGHRCGTK